MDQHAQDKSAAAAAVRAGCRTSLVTTMQTSRATMEMTQRSVGELHEQMRQTRALIRRSERLIRNVALPGACIGE